MNYYSESIPEEAWKPIRYYDGAYEVSNMGRVRSVDRVVKKGRVNAFQKGRLISFFVRKKGYRVVSLYKENKKKNWDIHQLVAIEFLSHLPCGLSKVVDHIDQNKENNNLSNLRIISNRDNLLRSIDRDLPHNVYPSKNRFRVRFNINGKSKSYGTYKTIAEAEKVAIEVSKKLFNITSTCHA